MVHLKDNNGWYIGWDILPFSIFHQHFKSSFCPDILLPKNYNAKLELEKIRAKHFCTKRACVKCWWNLHLLTNSSTALIFFPPKKIQSQTVIREKLHTALLFKKARVKCWWNWHLECDVLFEWPLLSWPFTIWKSREEFKEWA